MKFITDLKVVSDEHMSSLKTFAYLLYNSVTYSFVTHFDIRGPENMSRSLSIYLGLTVWQLDNLPHEWTSIIVEPVGSGNPVQIHAISIFIPTKS